MILRSYRKKNYHIENGSYQNLGSYLPSYRRARSPEKRLIPNLAVVLTLFVLLMPAFIFVSCTDAVNPPVPEKPAPEKPIPSNPVQIPSKLVTISGSMTAATLDENGAVPSFFVGDAQGSRAAYGADSEENASSRMALPTINFETLQDDNDHYYDYQLKATATKKNGTNLSEPVEREGTVTFGDTPGTGSFSIALETGYNWTIELGMRWCDGYENEYSTKLIARKTFTALTESDANTPISLTLKPQMSRANENGATADGSGRISLSVPESSYGLYDSYEIVLDGSNEDWTAANVTHSNGTITANSIKSGRYSVTLNFKKDGVIIYSSDQTINVYDNSTTNKWIGDGTSDSPINDDGVFSVTQTLINKFAGTNIYVASSTNTPAGSANGNGSSRAPVNLLAKAFELIGSRAAGVATGETENYTIRLLSNITENVIIQNGTFGVENASKIGKIIIKGYGAKKSITASDSGSQVISVYGMDPSAGAVPPVEFINLALTGGNRGLYASGEVNVTLTDCTISDNTTASGNGAGVYAGTDATVALTNCEITENTAASGNGAGVYADTDATVVLTNCEITENTASYGAGVLIEYNANVTLTGCTITENNTSGNDGYGMAGAGIYVACGNDKTVTIQNCTISGNTATNYNGGGIAAYNGNINLTNCTISGNSAKVGGGLYQYQYANAININGIEMTDNVATYGKGGAMGADSALYCSVKLAGNVKIPKGSEAGENDICLKDKPLYLEDGLALTDTVLITLDGYNTAEPMFTGSDSAYASNEGKFGFAISGSFESVFDYNVALSSSAIDVIPGSVIKVEAAVTKDGNSVTPAANDISWSFNLLCNGRPVPSVPASALASSLTTGAGYAIVRIPTTATVYSSMNYTLHVAATYKDITYDKDISLTYPWVLVTGTTVTGAVGSGGSAASQVFKEGRSLIIPDLYVSDHEVTQGEFVAVMETNPSTQDYAASGEIQENRPVDKINRYDAIAYCNKLSAMEGLTPCYTISGITDWVNFSYSSIPTSGNDTWNAVTCNFNANGYRLPTEAEWEYIARGGNGLTGTQYAYSGTNGGSDLTNYAWYSGNAEGKTHEVKKKAPNNLGIYDMSGNVYEWCWDYYGDIDSNTPASGPDTGTNGIIRGGDFSVESDFKVNRRNYPSISARLTGRGFRVVRTASYVFHDSVTMLPSGTNGTAGTTGSYAMFGDWPQTIKASGVTVDETKWFTMGGNTYYKGSDGNWYVKVTANPYTTDSNYTCSDGTQLVNGNNYYFKVEPIKWRVVTEDYNNNGKKLLLAENILTGNVKYYLNQSNRIISEATVYPNNYKYSTIRAYLNGSYESGDTQDTTTYNGKGFLQSAFTSSAQSLIATTTVSNGTSTFPCDNTDDRIFILSQSEATNSDYEFASSTTSDSKRILATTDYAKANHAYQGNVGNGGYWWTRTPFDADGMGRAVRYVLDNGTINDRVRVDFENVDNWGTYSGIGVVPALCVE